MKGINAIWHDLSGLLDIHGLHQIKEAKHTKKIIWSLLLGLAICVLVINLVIVTREFMYNPILTTYSFQSTSRMDFPNLYLCPANPINLTVVKNNKYTQDIIDDMLREYLHSLKAASAAASNDRGRAGHGDIGIASILAQKMTAMEQISEILTNIGGNYGGGGGGGPGAFRTPTIGEWCETFENETVYDFFKRIGYSTSEFIRECSFGGKMIDCAKYVTPVFDVNRGKCFILHLDGMVQRTSGSGLSLLIDIWTELYSTEKTRLSMFEGAFIKIEHSPDPTSTDTILLTPGQYTKIKLSRKIVKIINNTIGLPQQRCSGSGRLLQVFNLNYTLPACRADCLQAALNDQCNCLLPFDPHFIREGYKQKPPCSASKHSRCTRSILSTAERTEYGARLSKFEKRMHTCLEKCDKPCLANEYSSGLSFINFPSQAYMSAFQVDDPSEACRSRDINNHSVTAQNKSNTDDSLHGNSEGSYQYNCTSYRALKTSFSPSRQHTSQIPNNNYNPSTTTTTTQRPSSPVPPYQTSDYQSTNSPSPPAAPPGTKPNPKSDPCANLPYYHPRYDSHTWKGNYILLDVAFENMQVESIEQSPSMTISMFLSNIGGQFGLWIGASLLSLIQLGVYCCTLCCQGRGAKEKYPDSNDEYSLSQSSDK